MAQPSQPPSNHNLRNPNKAKAPIVVESINAQQEQREGIVETLTQTVTPEVQTPRDSFDPSAILRAGSIPAQATMLKRLNAAQGHEAAAHIGSTQGNRHLSKVVSTIKSTPNKPQTSPAPSIQTKLTVSEPGDQYEEEADRVADQVMRMAAPPPPPAGEDEENKPGVHRSALGLPPLVQASANGAPAVTPDLEASIQQLKGTGHPLPGTERTFFEERLSVDLSNVRVHTGPDAAQTSRDLSARAYTTGSDIVFNEGEYRPGSSDGRQLLAHELTHVVQQGGAARLKRAPDGTIQRKEDTGAGGEEEGPSEAEKAAAREAAAEAEAEAARAKATGEAETAAAQGEATVETQAAQAPQAEAAASQAKGPVDDSATQALEATAVQGAEAAKETAAQFAAGVASAGVGPAAPAMPGPAEAAAASPKGTGGTGGAPAQVPGKAEPGSGADPAEATQAAKSKVEGAFAQAESPPDKAPVSQAQDPAFQTVKGKTKSEAEEQKAHETASGKAAEAQAAAVSPPAETQSKAEANKVGTMEQTETPGFDAAGFKAALMQRIAELAPSSMEGADEFKERGGAAGVKDSMQGQLDETSQGTKGPLEEATSAEPDTGAVEPKEVTPLQPADPGTAPSAIGAEGAVPKTKGQGEVEAPLQESSQALDQQMADAEITEEQLEKSNEPEFTGALESKREAQASVAEAPGTYRQAEGELVSSAEADAVATAQTQIQSMHDTRSSALTQVQSQQEQTKTEDEQKRAEVAEHIQGIYQETESKVNEILTNLDDEVNREFDAGAEAARQVFENYVDRKMEAYKQDRYGGFWGWAKWVKDKLLGMPSEVNAFYAEGRNLYLSEMDAVIDTVVAIIGKRLAEAKAEIARGKQRIQEYVDKLPEDLQEVGQQAADEVQSRFDDLEQTVDAKQNELIDTLANKYQENLQALDARIEELKAANKGLVDHVLDAIGGVIKTILELKDMLLNVLARVAEVVMQIIKDPIGFLGNLIAGVKQGIQQFVSNIGTHLKKGFIAWLTGSLGEAGITLPEKFDLKGIFQLVMQVLGLSFDNIKQRVSNLLGFDLFGIIDKIIDLVKIYREEGFAGLLKYGIAQLIGEDKLQLLLSVIDIFKALMSGDLGAVWEIIKQHLSTLKEMVIDQIKSFIIEKVIKAGITWIIGLLNPAGAFIKACKAIYDIVMFFIERGSQIMALVNAVIDSVAAIVSGNISAAANMVETALARAIPVAIGFLASLLGLGGISQKVQEIIKKVRGAVDRALDAVFNSGPVQTVAKFIKKIIGKIKNFGKKVLEKGMKLLGLDMPLSMAGESHTVTVTSGPDAKVVMASGSKKPISTKVAAAKTKLNSQTPAPADKGARMADLTSIEQKATTIETDAKQEGLTEAQLKQKSQPLIEGIKAYGAKYNAEDIEDVLADEFPPPEVGGYASMLALRDQEYASEEKRLPDGAKRVPHHAPPVELAKSVGNECSLAADSLVAENPDSPILGQVKSAGERLNTAGQNAHSSSDTLMTILVHQQTHRSRGGPGPRIHGPEIREKLQARLKSEKGWDLDKLVKTKEGDLSINPTGSQYQEYFREIAQEAGGHQNIGQAIASSFVNVATTIYEREFDRSVMAVEEAVNSSVLDGPADKRTAKLRELRSKSNAQWKGLLGL